MSSNYIVKIKQLLSQARQKAYSAINSAMVEAYWQTGKRIIEEEQKGERRAEYGKQVIETLSKVLCAEFGKGFSERTLREFRQFYLAFPELFTIHQTESPETDSVIWRTLFAKLSWSHYQRVLKVSDKNTRIYYLTEAAQQNWSIRTLDRNISMQYYHRLLSSQINEPVEKEMLEKTKYFQNDKLEFIKNPCNLLILSQNDQAIDFWDLLSGWEKEDINAGIIDLDNGNFKDIKEVLAKW